MIPMLLAPTGGEKEKIQSLFEKFVSEGEEDAHVTLPLSLHTFLTSCLVEYLSDSDIAHRILTEDFFGSASLRSNYATYVLKRTGDAALLYAGLFPQRARRFNVTVDYFRHIGRGAYANYAALLMTRGMPDSAALYNEAAERFPLLTKVLLWSRRGPQSFWEILRRYESITIH